MFGKDSLPPGLMLIKHAISKAEEDTLSHLVSWHNDINRKGEGPLDVIRVLPLSVIAPSQSAYKQQCAT